MTYLLWRVANPVAIVIEVICYTFRRLDLVAFTISLVVVHPILAIPIIRIIIPVTRVVIPVIGAIVPIIRIIIPVIGAIVPIIGWLRQNQRVKRK